MFFQLLEHWALFVSFRLSCSVKGEVLATSVNFQVIRVEYISILTSQASNATLKA